MLVLETFMHIDDTGIGCEIIHIKSSRFLLGTTGGASWMKAKKEHYKHKCGFN